jgi:hypothetical protein
MADPDTPRDSTGSGDFVGLPYTHVGFTLPGAKAARRFAKELAVKHPIQVGEVVDVLLSPPTKRKNGKSTATKAPKRTKRVPGVVRAVFGDVVEVDVADGGGRKLKHKHKQVQRANVFRRDRDLATQLKGAGLLEWKPAWLKGHVTAGNLSEKDCVSTFTCYVPSSSFFLPPCVRQCAYRLAIDVAVA